TPVTTTRASAGWTWVDDPARRGGRRLPAGTRPAVGRAESRRPGRRAARPVLAAGGNGRGARARCGGGRSRPGARGAGRPRGHDRGHGAPGARARRLTVHVTRGGRAGTCPACASSSP